MQFNREDHRVFIDDSCTPDELEDIAREQREIAAIQRNHHARTTTPAAWRNATRFRPMGVGK